MHWFSDSCWEQVCLNAAGQLVGYWYAHIKIFTLCNLLLSTKTLYLGKILIFVYFQRSETERKIRSFAKGFFLWLFCLNVGDMIKIQCMLKQEKAIVTVKATVPKVPSKPPSWLGACLSAPRHFLKQLRRSEFLNVVSCAVKASSVSRMDSRCSPLTASWLSG